MADEKQKMQELLNKIWQNPSLAASTLDKKENQVLNFVRENEKQLQKVFATPEYFPNLSWPDAKRMLITNLVEKVLANANTSLDKVFENLFTHDFLDHTGISIEIKEKLHAFILDLLKNKTYRDPYLLTIQTISLKFFERYIEEACLRHKVIYNELLRRDRIKADEIILHKYITFSALFMPLFYLKVEKGSSATSLAEVKKSTAKYQEILQILTKQLTEKIGSIPAETIRFGVDSQLLGADHNNTSGAAKLIGIFTARTRDYVPMQNQDRGADTPDKSWFSIARLNAKYYGYDSNILDELFQIAADRGY